MDKTIYKIKKYKNLKADIQEMKLQIEEIKSDTIGISGCGGGEKTGKTNKFNSSVEDQVIILQKKTSFLEAQIKNKEIQIQRIENALTVLNPEEREIIEMLCIRNLKYYMVQEKLHRSYPGIKRIEKNASEKMKKYIS